jgi:E3 ubiquitin-protein ligase MUL1
MPFKMELTVANEIFEEFGWFLIHGTFDYLQGLKMLGVKKVEKVFLIGTTFAIVGEIIQKDHGLSCIQKPHKGSFYVTPKNIE